MLKKIFILFYLMTNALEAQSALAGLILFPDNAKGIIGISGGMAYLDQKIHIHSTESSKDGLALNYFQTAPNIIIFLGLENDIYRISVSFEGFSSDDISMQQLIFGFNYKFLQGKKLHPMLGFGIGAAESTVKTLHEKISFSNGIYTLNAGVEFRHNDHHAIEVMTRYFRFLNSGSGTQFTETEFTSYNLHEQNGISVQLGYTYRF